MTTAPASYTPPGSWLTALPVRRLPWPLVAWPINARTLVRQPMALTTMGALFRRDLVADAGMPWWNDRAIRYFAQHLWPGDRAFEWGSGACTIWMIARGAEVISVEHDPDWASTVRARCPAADVRTVPDNARDYVAAIKDFGDGSLDVVIVDGRYRADGLRGGFLRSGRAGSSSSTTPTCGGSLG